MVQEQIRAVTLADYGAVFSLQRAAFVDEARIYGTPFVPALDETLGELSERMETSESWVALHDGRIVGAVSLRDYRVGGPDVERLMVAPDRRGTGLSRRLLRAAEEHAAADGHRRLQLIVGDLAIDNRAIYRHLGWVEQSTEPLVGFEHVILHTMTKELS